jgi:hypothetical protein
MPNRNIIFGDFSRISCFFNEKFAPRRIATSAPGIQ